MENIVTKKCSKCKLEKDISEFYKKRPDCKVCHAKKTRSWYLFNFEKVKEQSKKWHAENPQKSKEAQKTWRNNHPDKVKEHYKKYANKEKKREWYLKNVEKMAEIGRRRYIDNVEKIKSAVKRWREQNPEKCRVFRNNRRARYNGTFSVKEWLDLCDRYDNRCLCCGEKKPLTKDHVIPISLGGTNTIDNIQCLCKNCNSKKHTKTTDYRR